MDLTLSGVFSKMYKPEVTEELSICGSVPSILGFAKNGVLKLGCSLEIPGKHQTY